MGLRILVVPDKFKGTLTARQAATAIAQGWRKIRPDDHIEKLPMSDGGDGFGEVMGHLLRAQRRICTTINAAGQPRKAQWWLEPDTRTAIIEAAQVNGLTLLPKGQHHPFKLDTFGIGKVLLRAKQAGARRLYIGIGGSATNDGGFGLARALGWHFWDAYGTELITWTALDRLAQVEAPLNRLSFGERIELIIATDVKNPLLGAKGASWVYGPQKGLREDDIPQAEACLEQLAKVMADRRRGEDFSLLEGAGAAGGLGFGLKAFCGGNFESGFEIFARTSRLKPRIQAADLVITGEGKMDAQTIKGEKGVAGIAKMTANAGKCCLCLAGSVSVDPADVPWPNFKSYAIVEDIVKTYEEAREHPDDYLCQLAERAARELH